MDFSAVCRTCLSEHNLNPIFLNLEDFKPYCTAVYLTTGIKVNPNDGLPQNMCTVCVTKLNNALKFRKLCQKTEMVLFQHKSQMTTAEDEKYDFDFKVGLEKKEEYLLESLLDDGKKCDDKKIDNNIKKTDDNYVNFKIEKEPLDANEEDNEVKDEYTDYEALEDDDKPLKYLIGNESDIDNITDGNVEKLCAEKLETALPYIPDRTDTTDTKRLRVTCKLCQKNLSVRSIDTHMARSHPGADERKQKCDLCDTYVLRDKMTRHRKMMHGSEHALRCGYCKSEFDCKEVLIQHVTMCTAKKKRRKVSEASKELQECDVCHKKMQKASLRMHKAIKHAGLGPVCEHCGRRFGNKFRLKEHYRAKHGYEKFKCSYCDFQSASLMALRNHERRHRGEKPFVCETCDAKFHAAYLLAQHRQSHRTEKLIKCDLCPASFKANNSLHMHKITCHSKSLYKCTMCSSTYSCRHYAVKHMRHVHDYRGPVPELETLQLINN